MGNPARSTFWQEQARRRAQATRWLMVAGLLVLALSVVLSFFIQGVLLLQLGIVFGLLDIFVDLPKWLWAYHNVFGAAAAGFFDPIEQDRWPGLGACFTFFAIAVLPGLVATVSLWLWIFRALARAELSSLFQAHAPRADDFEETQVRNLVAEMAIAAGMPSAPRVLILPDGAVNAGVYGGDATHITVLVPRGLLQELDRAPTQAVIAHLLAHVANGDARLSVGVLALLQTYGVIVTVLDLPFGRGPWQRLAAFFRAARGGFHGERFPSLLKRAMDMDEVGSFMGGKDGEPGYWRSLRTFPLIPLILGNVLSKMLLAILLLLLIGPFVALALRRRRFLADASAVQFTRDPSALVNALRTLAARGEVTPTMAWAEQAFIVGREVRDARAMQGMVQEMQTAAAAGGGAMDQISARMAAVRRMQQQVENTPESAAQESLLLFGLHPALNKRIERVAALGGN